MTPAERQLVTDLFDRLAALENSPRDPEAERVIDDGLRQAPNATYALVQSVLVQDEALKRADARIRELESDLGIQSEPQRAGGFLDSMRESVFGRKDERRGSVPNVRPGDAPPMGAPAGFRTGASPWPQQQQQQPPQPQPGYGGGGGSFLGTAAAAAAGAIGGSLLMNSLGGLMGGHRGGGSAHAMTGPDAAREGGSPWGNAGGGDLARQAGLDDIGRSGDGVGSSGRGSSDQGFGLFDTTSDKTQDNAFDNANVDNVLDDGDADFDDGSFDSGGDGGGD